LSRPCARREGLSWIGGPHAHQGFNLRGAGYPRPMDTWRAIDTIRVVREFDPRPIENAHLDRILNAGRRTGSSKNRQDWAFIVVRERSHLRELAAVGRYASHLAGAALAVALVRPVARDEHQLTTFLWDLGRAAQNMVLAAWELGIGSVPATVYDLDLAAALLRLPSDRRCDFLLSFGYPADPSRLTAPKRAGGRRSLPDLVHEEHW
jgi:nitroreductase